ncbi:MAG: ABC transporter substrate-binding protein [Kangiellaceae bacterium]|nr:ABC transporter substrate-binding protein [Kangiellaceae bacterium]
MKNILAIIMLITFAPMATAQDDPSVFLENVANNMINQVEKNKTELKTNKLLAQKLVKDTLLPAIDTHEFARRTLSTKKNNTWKSLSEKQQQRFVEQFIDLVIGNYATGLALYDGQKFKFSKPHFSKTGKSARVRSSLEQAGSTPIIIDYTLSIKTGSWKIIDLKIEGVSMSKSYKSQFLPRIKTMGMDAFLAEMESKNPTKNG